MELTGVISSLKRDFGFIRADTILPQPYTNKDIYFRFNTIRGNCSPSINQQVKFALNKNKPERPNAKYVIILNTSDQSNNNPNDENETNGQDEFTKHTKGVKYRGIVITLKDQFGFIKLEDELPGPFPRKNVYFRLTCIKNKDILVKEGNTVVCEINESSKPDRPSAKRVTVIVPGETMSTEPETPTQRTTHVKEFYIGIVAAIIQQEKGDIGFIKPSEELPSPYPEDRDVFFYISSVQSGNLDLMVGDEVEFSLGTKDKKRPFSFRVKLIKCNPNIPYSERMENYLRQSLDRITDESKCRSEHILSLLSCTGVWQKIGEEKELSINAINLLMNLIEQLEKQSRGLEENLRNILKILTSTHLFNHKNGSFKIFVEETINSECVDIVSLMDIQKFLLLIMKYVPEKTRAIAGIIKPVVSKNSKEIFLYEVLKQLCRNINELCIEDMEWNELPLVPSLQEILHGTINNNAGMKAVKVNGRYSSVEDYMDTYFRLLRADCFDGLVQGIKALLTGNLDERDMFVYHNIELVGVVITQNENGITLGMKVTPQVEVQNWDTAPNLVFGNLLCISPNGNFKDVIWATVMSRALLKNLGIVLLDLCTESNTMSDPVAIRMIEASGGRGFMVESPTYYRAYHPVLKTLQKIDPQQMTFSDELVAVQPSIWPGAITIHSTYEKAVLSSESVGQDVLINLLSSDVINCKLDRSQEIAVKQALKNRIAIIQGPPGTGKTFVGIKLLELLVSLQPAVKLPILVLTYKNHALDEFLMAMLKIFPGKVARVGGRSLESGLEGCNVNQLKREKLSSIDPILLNDIHQFQAKIEELKPKVEDSFKKLEKDKTLTIESLRKHLRNNQIQYMLTGCEWDEVKLPSFLYKEGQNISGGVKSKKKSKLKLMNKEEALQLLEALEMDAEVFVSKCKAENLQNLRQHIDKMVIASIEQWIPVKSEFDSLSEVSHNMLKLNKKGCYDYSGEKDTLKIEEERLAAYATDLESKEEILKNIILLQKGSSTNWMPTLISSVKDILDDLPLGFLANTENLWQLPPKERVLFIQAILFNTFEENAKHLVELLQDYQRLCKSKSEIENQHKIGTLRKMTVVGMTITGASIQHDLLSQLKPEIILVEEAAEVLEPQLVAALGNWCKHLILIGDHMQLKPQVQSITLERDFHFNVSMMERLINNDLDYATLNKQNRMRPEFAEMLLDIYPQLQSNYNRVVRNKIPSCISSSMFFWNHSAVETKHHHTFTNQEEADRAIKLALFFIQQGYNPSQITILGSYLRQVRLIRVGMSKAQRDHASIMDLHNHASDKKGSGDKLGNVKIQTIDNYQGDENDIVIVSLVRCNGHNIGFLKEINRRCVAQSRARCGMYFIGNKATFSQPPWKRLIDHMEEKGLTGDKIHLQCPRHDIYSRISVECADEITLGCFCDMKCGKLMDCNRHLCGKKCQPNHKHRKCEETVSFIFKSCGHMGTRKCSEKESDILCRAPIEIKFNTCSHIGSKLCYQKREDVKCTEKCKKILPCYHECEGLCSMPCVADTCRICILLKDIEQDKRRRKEEAQRRQVRQDISDEIEKLKKAPIDVEISEVKPHGDTASEYYDIEDKVKKYIKADHSWFPVVTKIEKVSNKKLKLKWMEKKKAMFDPCYTALKFHGTNKEAVDSIVKNGFRMPVAKGQMFGPGIYFATDSSKSAQDIYTKGSNTLMLCRVLLGKPLTVHTARTDMTEKYLKDRGYDSLYAKRETKATGGVLHDEYVVYHPDAALPEYIIHYVRSTDDQILKVLQTLEMKAIAGTSLVRHTIKPKRIINKDDPLDIHFRIAESQFLRLIKSDKYKGTGEICEVEYCLNPKLMIEFSKKRLEYGTKYQGKQRDYILAFHGTQPQYIDGIVTNNFDLNKLSVNSGDNGWYGAGIYFSEFPNVSLAYGKSLLLCKILPGKAFDVLGRMDGKGLQQGFDSHRVNKDNDGRGEEIVIFNPSQILPCYIIKLK